MGSMSNTLRPGKGIVRRFNLISVLFSFCHLFAVPTAFGFQDSLASTADYWRSTITAEALPGGSISPEGSVVVWRFQNQSFEIIPDNDFEILDVLVDEESLGAIPAYTFERVVDDHSITAEFLARSYIITATAGVGGSIDPSGDVKVKKGKDQTFKIIPDDGYVILDVFVDGESVGAVDEYMFKDVTETHTIHATFSAAFGVLDLSIPNVSMMIGDRVIVSITVTDDGQNPYTFVSGTVGGYPLQGFQRITSTHYEAYFNIIQGGESYRAEEDIPVSDLVISSGGNQSVPYDRPVIQDRDPLDAALPVIRSMAVEGGVKKIGDLVILNIYADGISYSADPLSSINGIPLSASNVIFGESGEGNYMLSYTVQEGDPDVVPGLTDIEATMILVKPSGNVGLPYSIIDNPAQLAIDAHRPVVSRMEVTTQEMGVGVGGTVRMQVTADGLAYTATTGTMVNGVPLESPRVSFSELSEGLYELTYLVAAEDAAVPPGMLQATVVVVDPAGNTGDVYSSLEPNTLEIYTERPEVEIEGPADICEGDESVLVVHLTGRTPMSFVLDDGTATTAYTDITTAYVNIDIAPVQTTIYQISSLTDENGVVNPDTTVFQVTVNQGTEVEIINLAMGYSVEDDAFQLEANVMGGIFSGPGVNSEEGTFDPGLADTTNSPHTIYYDYINDYGCSSMDSALVYVAGTNGAILIPGKTACQNDDPFIVSVLNIPGVLGSFRLLDSFSQPVAGLTDHGDNTASIDPALLDLDTFIIEFQYLDVVKHSLRETFDVETVSQPEIMNLNENFYCQSDEPFELISDMNRVVFEGPGVSGNAKSGFIFNPSEAGPGEITIVCTAFSMNGCAESIEKRVIIGAAPDVRFGMSSTCNDDEGEVVSFENQSIGTSFVETWSWDFGDPASGADNFSSLMNPTHFYQETGEKRILLTATTREGCVGSFELDTIVDSKPVADFTWISNCLDLKSGVKFINTSSNVSARVDTIIWTFKNSQGTLLGAASSDSPTDTVAFVFEEAGSYQVDLYIMNYGGCSDEITKSIQLRPGIPLDSDAYIEGFDVTGGLWIVQSEDHVESWVWGVPDFTGYLPVPTDKAWFTQLPDGTAGYYENSWVQSPCFDFSDMKRPLIRMDIMKSFVPGMNGAVLQYQDVFGEGWKTVGEDTPGIAWYNSSTIYNEPGGSSTGWGLDVFNPDTEWVTAAHNLDQVAGKSNVALRVAFASNGALGMNNQGFAFNNVIITERSKLAVLEHFTDNSYDNSRLADDIIDGIATLNAMDVIDLQYHTSSSGMDLMNLNNPHPPSTRSWNYGDPPIPYTVLDGGVDGNHQYDFANLEKSTVEDHLQLLTLEVPAFEIDLNVDWHESGLEVRTNVTCLTDGYEENIQLYLVVFETSVTAYTGSNGDTHFRNVVLDMMPTEGKLLGNNWTKGKSEFSIGTWDYKPYVEDIEELAVAAFLQDRNTFQILQAAVNYKDKTVGIPDAGSNIKGLSISPNPADNMLHVNLGVRTTQPGSIVLLDMSGKVVLVEPIPPGYQLIQLEIEHLNRGMYILQWIESGQVRGVTKVVKPR